jgi:hypothetical protein
MNKFWIFASITLVFQVVSGINIGKKKNEKMARILLYKKFEKVEKVKKCKKKHFRKSKI